MRSSYAVQFCVLAIVCLIVSGCGGSASSSSGGGVNNNPTAVTFTFSGATPAAVATKVGTGSFAAATVSSNTVTLSVPSGTKNFGIAWSCAPYGASPATSQQYVLESTTTDGDAYSLNCFRNSTTGTGGTLTLSVDASAFSATTSFLSNFVQIEAENGSDVSLQFPNGLVADNYTLTAPSGSDTVNLSVNGFNVSDGFATEYMLAAKSFSGVSVPGNLSNGSTITFTSADAAVQQPITYANVPAGYSAPTSTVNVTPSGEIYGFFLIQNATSNYPALPAAIAQSSDRYHLTASAFGSVGSGQQAAYQYVTEIEDFTGEGPVAVTFPAPWSYSGPAPAALPSMNINYSGFSGQSGVAESGNIQWVSSSNANVQYDYQVTATANYLGGSTSLQFPDLSTLSGFFAAPSTGTTVNWQAQMSQNSAGIAPVPLTRGNEFIVSAFGAYTVP